MMDSNDHLQELWQRQKPAQVVSCDLFDKVRRHRRAMIAHRIVEVALTIAAIGIFAGSILASDVSPKHWLLMPFFSVFLIVVWTTLLRQPLATHASVFEQVSVYAKLRQQQLRLSLNNLQLAKYSAIALLIYATAALVGAYLFGDAAWQSAASVLLAYSALWYLGTRWLVRHKRRIFLREYRAMSRIA